MRSLTKHHSELPRSRPGAAAGGCVTVKAPDKPIEINLNVAIKQEVVVRLQQDVQQLIQQNPQAFPPAPTKP